MNKEDYKMFRQSGYYYASTPRTKQFHGLERVQILEMHEISALCATVESLRKKEEYEIPYEDMRS